MEREELEREHRQLNNLWWEKCKEYNHAVAENRSEWVISRLKNEVNTLWEAMAGIEEQLQED